MSGNNSASGPQQDLSGPGTPGAGPSTSNVSNNNTTSPRRRNNIRRTGRSIYDVLENNVNRPYMTMEQYLQSCGSFSVEDRMVRNLDQLASVPFNDPALSAASVDDILGGLIGGAGPAGISASSATAASGEATQASIDSTSASAAGPSNENGGDQSSQEDVLDLPEFWADFERMSAEIFDWSSALADEPAQSTPGPSQPPVDVPLAAVASSSSESLQVTTAPSAPSTALDLVQDTHVQAPQSLQLLPAVQHNLDSFSTGMPGAPGFEGVDGGDVQPSTAAPQNPTSDATNSQPAQATNVPSQAPVPATVRSSSQVGYTSGTSKSVGKNVKPSTPQNALSTPAASATNNVQPRATPRGSAPHMSAPATANRNTPAPATAQSSSRVQNTSASARPTTGKSHQSTSNPARIPPIRGSPGALLATLQGLLAGSQAPRTANGINPAPQPAQTQATVANPQTQRRQPPQQSFGPQTANGTKNPQSVAARPQAMSTAGAPSNGSANFGMTRDVKAELIDAALLPTASTSSASRMPPPNSNVQLRQSSQPPRPQHPQATQQAAARPMGKSISSSAPTSSTGTTQSARPTAINQQSSSPTRDQLNAARAALVNLPPEKLMEFIAHLEAQVNGSQQPPQQFTGPQMANGGVKPALQMVQTAVVNSPRTQLQRQPSQQFFGSQANGVNSQAAMQLINGGGPYNSSSSMNSGIPGPSGSIMMPPNSQLQLPLNGRPQHPPQPLQRPGSFLAPGMAAPAMTQSFNGVVSPRPMSVRPNGPMGPPLMRPSPVMTNARHPSSMNYFVPHPAAPTMNHSFNGVPNGGFVQVSMGASPRMWQSPTMNHSFVGVPNRAPMPQRAVAGPSNYAPMRPSPLLNNAVAGPSNPTSLPRPSPRLHQQPAVPHGSWVLSNGAPHPQQLVRQGSILNSPFMPGVGMVNSFQAPGMASTMASPAGIFQQVPQVRQRPSIQPRAMHQRPRPVNAMLLPPAQDDSELREQELGFGFPADQYPQMNGADQLLNHGSEEYGWGTVQQQPAMPIQNLHQLPQRRHNPENGGLSQGSVATTSSGSTVKRRRDEEEEQDSEAEGSGSQ
ncbi:hypothetical protein EST38_g2086 [Candolleomyces aberdarensis]|uniref:Uncharacterized protein n=1 Tax=Candolleomyces aberdarensis TaxID=2316362 RepID=A0A4Q2DXN9_9AGAR|nr:hypothetical protein EST38_g2086 [Candolleomyces aberdarensis]